MPLIDAIHENRLLSRWAQLLPRPAAAIGSIHEADAELVPLDEARWLAVKVDTVAEEITAGLYTDPATAGRIAAVGQNVTARAEGDRVTFDSTVYCGACPHCLRGNINLCDNRQVLGVSCGDYRRAGAFAEYVVVPARIVYRLPDQLSFTEAAMLEAVSVALHAVAARRLRSAVANRSETVHALLRVPEIIQCVHSVGLGKIRWQS